MRSIILLMLISGQAAAWPWTTVDDCVEKYVPKTESNQGARIVRSACISKYQYKSQNDGLFDCIMDKVPSAKTDTAASMLVNLCRKENPTPPLTAKQLKLKLQIEEDLRNEAIDKFIREGTFKFCSERYADNPKLHEDCMAHKIKD